VSELLASNRD